MDYSSIPPYLDPSNWNQNQNQNQNQHHLTGSSGDPRFSSPLPPLPLAAASIRPGSMLERARMANLPIPEGALKCPRCDSTNTKFCYFNNYSLSQPRHFCKTCRRYWTRGGALRSVPVGGGCRRNKRTKGGAPKTAAPARGSSAASAPSCGALVPSKSTCGSAAADDPAPPLRFMPCFDHLSDYASPEMGFSYSGLSAEAMVGATGDTNFPVGLSNLLGGGGGQFCSGGVQWRSPSLPFMGDCGGDGVFEAAPYALDVEGCIGGFAETGYGGVRPNRSSTSSLVLNHLASVKIEDGNRVNPSSEFSDLSSSSTMPNYVFGNYWEAAASGGGAADPGGRTWMDPSRLSS